jgi:large subunit ribosomal protein L10
MNREIKEKVVEDLRATLVSAPSVLLASATGISVNTVNDLRSKLRAKGISFRVVKNTLAKRAIAGTDMEILAPSFSGPTVVAYHPEEPGLAAKVLLDFKKENENFVIKTGYADGVLLDAAGVETLSKLPGKDELRSQIAGLMTAVPSKLLSVFKAAQVDVVGLLKAREADIS